MCVHLDPHPVPVRRYPVLGAFHQGGATRDPGGNARWATVAPCARHAISYVVTRPRHVTINEMLIRPTEQER